jgi:hypothetical protein
MRVLSTGYTVTYLNRYIAFIGANNPARATYVP